MDGAGEEKEDTLMETSTTSPKPEPFVLSMIPTAAIPEPREPALLRLARAFLEGNYFYVISALLMMLGCYWLMPGSLLEAEQFQRRVKALLLLQGYELLVIATAAAIVLRLKILGDAFILFVIELVLLLDPTFFSNAFFTLKTSAGVMVNVICVVLVPIKLVILQRVLRLRIAPRAFAALVFAALFVFLGEGPLNLRRLPISQFSYYGLLMWGTFAVMLLLPPIERLATPASHSLGYASVRQRVWLCRYLLWIPLAIVAAHLVETRKVYDIPFYALFVTPLLLSVALLMVKTLPPKKFEEAFLVVLDFLALVALVFSLPASNLQVNTSVPQSFRAPDWVLSPIPLGAWAISALCLYGSAFLRWGCTSAFYRMGAIVMGGCVYVLFKTRIPGKAAVWTSDHPLMLLLILGLLVTAAAIRWRDFWSWLAAGTTWLILGVAVLVSHKIWLVPEGIQLFFVLLMVLYHLYGDPRSERHVCATVVAAIAFLRLVIDPGWWQTGVVVAESTGLLTAAVLLRQPGYLAVGGAQGSLLALYVARVLPVFVPPALIAVAGSMVLFAVGVCVSFQKNRLLAGLERGVAYLGGKEDQTKEH
jgi:hypothetical protein